MCIYLYLYLNSISPYWLLKPSDIEHVVCVCARNWNLWYVKACFWGISSEKKWFVESIIPSSEVECHQFTMLSFQLSTGKTDGNVARMRKVDYEENRHHSPWLNKWSGNFIWSFHCFWHRILTCKKLSQIFCPIYWLAGKSRILSECQNFQERLQGDP